MVAPQEAIQDWACKLIRYSTPDADGPQPNRGVWPLSGSARRSGKPLPDADEPQPKGGVRPLADEARRAANPSLTVGASMRR